MDLDITAYHRILTLLLQRLLSEGQHKVAQRTGLSDATISRWKDSHLDTTARVLLALGLDVVPAGSGNADSEELRSLALLCARQAAELERSRRQREETSL